MSADKREFVNFNEFSGEIDPVDGWYKFPTLYKISTLGQTRQWNIYIRLITKDTQTVHKEKTDWNVLLENAVDIKQEYLADTCKLDDGLVAQFWTETGIVNRKITRQPATYTQIKNAGKKNERSSLHSALIAARGKYLKKLEEGYVASPFLLDDSAEQDTQLTLTTKMYFPMLAKNYKDLVDKIKYPVFIQPKLDGLRCVAYLRDGFNKVDPANSVILYSRQKKEFPHSIIMNYIRTLLAPILVAHYDEKTQESIYIDGEFYLHGKSLQEISSIARGSVNTQKDGVNIEYHIFDVFRPSLHSSFEARAKFIKEKIKIAQPTGSPPALVKIVPTHFIRSRQEDDALYLDYINKKYEGTIIRNPAGIYATSLTQKNSALRSKDLLKRKEVYAGEFELVGFTQGEKGKDIGAVIWICQTANSNNEPVMFNVMPINITYNERYELYKECLTKFDSKYKHRKLTVEYRGLSNDNIPQHAKALSFRDIM